MGWMSGSEAEYELGSSTVSTRDFYIHVQTQTDLDGLLSSCDFFFFSLELLLLQVR